MHAVGGPSSFSPVGCWVATIVSGYLVALVCVWMFGNSNNEFAIWWILTHHICQVHRTATTCTNQRPIMPILCLFFFGCCCWFLLCYLIRGWIQDTLIFKYKHKTPFEYTIDDTLSLMHMILMVWFLDLGALFCNCYCIVLLWVFWVRGERRARAHKYTCTAMNGNKSEFKFNEIYETNSK